MKVNRGLYSVVSGSEKKVLVMLITAYYFLVLGFKLPWHFNVFGTVVVNGGVIVLKICWFIVTSFFYSCVYSLTGTVEEWGGWLIIFCFFSLWIILWMGIIVFGVVWYWW